MIFGKIDILFKFACFNMVKNSKCCQLVYPEEKHSTNIVNYNEWKLYP